MDPWDYLLDLAGAGGDGTDSSSTDTSGGGSSDLFGSQDWGQAVKDALNSYGLLGGSDSQPLNQPDSQDSGMWGGEARARTNDSGSPQTWNLDTLLQRPRSMWNDASGWLDKLAAGDRQTTGQAKLGIGALGMLGSLIQSRRPRGQLTPGQLQAMLKSPYSNWTPEQQASFNAYFYKPLPKFQYQPPNVMGHARGGSIHGAGCACKMCNGGALGMLSGGYVSGGPTGGQGDHIPARLSPGEYVMDADVVSALGDGDNATGAKMLDEMREHIRQHKRGASPKDIPPRAKSPLAYLGGKRHGA